MNANSAIPSAIPWSQKIGTPNCGMYEMTGCNLQYITVVVMHCGTYEGIAFTVKIKIRELSLAYRFYI